MTGTIKKIMRQKGFGFIKPDDGSEDVFFHRGSLAPRGQIEDLNEGDTVQFQSRKCAERFIQWNTNIPIG